jgi:hypothetical protein
MITCTLNQVIGTMTIWIATLSNDLDEKAPIREVEVEADSDLQAIEILDAQDWDESWAGYSLVNVKARRGGIRPGAGRPKGVARDGTYGTGVKTKPVRVPETIADQLGGKVTKLS